MASTLFRVPMDWSGAAPRGISLPTRSFYNQMALESRGGCYKLCDWEHHDSEAIGCARHRVGCADTLPALPRADGHYRDQDEVLRRVLRVQGLPRGACGPPHRGVGGERMGAEGDTLRGLRRGVDGTAVHGGRVLL